MISFPVFWIGSVVIYIVALALVSWCFWEEINSDLEDVIWSLGVSILPVVNLVLSCLYILLIVVHFIQERKKLTHKFIRMIS